MVDDILLKQVVRYSEKRVPLSSITVSNYVTTDNILQNKKGIVEALGLPPTGTNISAFDNGHILVGNIRPYLKKIWYADRKGGCSADVLNFQVKEGFDSKFVYYAMFRDDFFAHVVKGSKGSKMPRGDKDQILNYIIPNYDIGIQQKIAGVLSVLDSKIELNNKINAELEQMAKTLYDYWFVQFDFPDENGKPYKSSGGNTMWNDRLNREIPAGWEVYRIDDILETSLGGTPSTRKKEYWENGQYNWLNSGEVANFPVINSELKISKEAIDNSATELLPRGTTVLSITRHLRPSILAIDACVNQSVVGIKGKDEINYCYLYPYLKNEVPRFMSVRTGAQQPHINKDTIDSSLIVLPNKNSNILVNYNCKVKPIYDMIINNSFQVQQLAELRDWLLPMLMNGQVTVKDDEKVKDAYASEIKPVQLELDNAS